MVTLLDEGRFEIEAMVDQFLEQGVSLVSFDVFDTLITRKVSYPAALFKMMEKGLGQSISGIPPNLIVGFYEVRREAESDLYRKNGPAITHQEIYNAIRLRWPIAPDILEAIRLHEIALERELVIGVPRMVKLVNKLMARGIPVVFSSDMYLSREVIGELLALGGIRAPVDAIYVSSEVQKSKSNGTLFEWLLGTYKLEPNQLLHLGDHPGSDVLVPQGLGIRALPVSECALSPRERDLASSGSMEGQLLAGFSRAARLALQRDGDCGVSTRLGIEVAGPTFTAYVGWVLNNLKSLPDQKIYFVARDGQVFHQIAQVICANGGPWPELHYLYGSRQAWHLPGVHIVDDHVLDWLCEADPILTLGILAKRLDMRSDVLSRLLSSNGLPVLEVSQPLEASHVKTLKQVLRSKAVSNALRDHARNYREKVLAYLKQEGALTGTSLNIVDIGWNGRIQDSLVRVLNGTSIFVNGFYFGLKRYSHPSSAQRKTAFFYSKNSPRKFRNLGDKMNGILEVFASADHGSTKGYHFDDGTERWLPTLYEWEEQTAKALGLVEFRKGIVAFAVEYASLSRFFDYSGCQVEEIRTSLYLLMKGFFHQPEAQEASLVGSVRWTSDQSSHIFRSFAPPLSFREAIRYVFTPQSGKRMLITSWVEGSMAQSGIPSRVILSGYLYVKALGIYGKSLLKLGA